MTVEQIYSYINTAVDEATGGSVIVAEDLSNLVDVGSAVLTTATAVDSFVQKLADKIRRTDFDDKIYTAPNTPQIYFDNWEYASVLEVVDSDLVQAKVNESYNLTDNQDYSMDVFHKPSVSVKFFNKMETYDYDNSYSFQAVKSAFTSAESMNAFINMLKTKVRNSIEVSLQKCIKATICNMIGEQVIGGGNYIDILTPYNTMAGTNLTYPDCLFNKDFLKYASFTIAQYSAYLKDMSVLNNAGGYETFTRDEDLKYCMLSAFEKSAEMYLDSDTFHETLVKLPNTDIVTNWQGSGTSHDLNNDGMIIVKPSSDNTKTVTCKGVLAIAYDRYSVGVNKRDIRTYTHFNKAAEFYNDFTKVDVGHFNNLNRNFIVFGCGTPTVA